MPLKGTKDERFDEFRHGKTFSKTRAKFGAKTANRQMVAAVLNSKRKGKKAARKRA